MENNTTKEKKKNDRLVPFGLMILVTVTPFTYKDHSSGPLEDEEVLEGDIEEAEEDTK